MFQRQNQPAVEMKLATSGGLAGGEQMRGNSEYFHRAAITILVSLGNRD